MKIETDIQKVVPEIKTKRPNWSALKLEYVNSCVSLEDLATRRGVSFDALRKKAERGKWFDERRRVSQKVATSAQEQIEAQHIHELGRINAKDLAIANRLRAQVEQALDDASKPGALPLAPALLRQLSAVILSAQKITRVALGLPTEIHEHAGQNGGAIAVRPTFDEKDIPLVKEAVMWALKNV